MSYLLFMLIGYVMLTIADFDKWLSAEPPMWRVFAWCRWKRERPVWMEAE